LQDNIVPERHVERNYAAEFDRRLKKFRKWGIYLALWVLSIFTGPFIVIAVAGAGEILVLYMGITALAVMPAFIQMVRLCRCPKCENFIGFRGVENCPICDTRLKQ